MENNLEEQNYFEKYQRLFADLENIKKRHAREMESVKYLVTKDVLSDVLDLSSDIDLIVSKFGNDNETILLLKQKFDHFLLKREIQKIDTSNYNPEEHEVVFASPEFDSTKPTKISGVISTGYKLGQNVIKYAKVSVENC